MSIKKWFITKDTTITNAYKENLKGRATDANMGLSDSLEVFFIYNQTSKANPSSADKLEEARIIIYPKFQDIWDYYGTFPTDAKFILRLFNAPHPFTLPKNYTLQVHEITDSWDEGHGLDMESYKDVGFANWTNRKEGLTWDTTIASGTGTNLKASKLFDLGTEDLEVDLTSAIQAGWNNGEPETAYVIKFSSTDTDDSGDNTLNFYTKKFFARSSEFFFKRPVIEVRRQDAVEDNRGNFYKASSGLSATDNQRKLYFYNSVNGVRKSLETGGSTFHVRLYQDSTYTTAFSPDLFALASETALGSGIYVATVTVPEATALTKIYDRWYISADAGTTETSILKEGSIKVLTRDFSTDSGNTEYVLDVINMKPSYLRTEKPKFRVYTRAKDWSPTIYTVASKEIENLIIDKIYYKIVRLVDDAVVVDYGNGTSALNKEHTLLSYDASGSYFDFDMSSLESGYMYGIKFMLSVNGELKEQDEVFKFRVD